MNKVKFLEIGARGKIIDFTDSYTDSFLHKHNLKRYDLVSKYTIDHLTTVQTKYGELVVHANDVVTYVGDDIWASQTELLPDNEESKNTDANNK